MLDPKSVLAEAHALSNAGDHDAHLRMFDERALITTPGNVREGREAIADFTRVWQEACPDARITVVNQVASGDMVAEEFVFEGTHSRTLTLPDRQVPPTDLRLTIHGALFARVVDGKIVSERVYLDERALDTALEGAEQTASP